MKYSNFLFARQAMAYDYLSRKETTEIFIPLHVRSGEQIKEASEKVEIYNAFSSSNFKIKS